MLRRLSGTAPPSYRPTKSVEPHTQNVLQEVDLGTISNRALVGIAVRLCSIRTRGTVEVSLVFECIMVLWYYGIMVLWYYGIMVLWYYDIVVLLL